MLQIKVHKNGTQCQTLQANKLPRWGGAAGALRDTMCLLRSLRLLGLQELTLLGGRPQWRLPPEQELGSLSARALRGAAPRSAPDRSG